LHERLAPKEQLEWLEAQVAAGHVEKARASIARGDVISGEEFFRRLNAKIDDLRST